LIEEAWFVEDGDAPVLGGGLRRKKKNSGSQGPCLRLVCGSGCTPKETVSAFNSVNSLKTQAMTSASRLRATGAEAAANPAADSHC